MARYILAPAAERDIEAILAHSHEHFGEQARLRYEALLVQAIRDIVDDPDRTGSDSRPELAEGACTYHLYFSRNRVSVQQGRVRRPRHFLLYRTSPGGVVEIGRVFHDRMDLDRHLPEEYRSQTADEERETEKNGIRAMASRVLIIRLPESLRERIRALARKTGRTESELAREVLAEYCNRHRFGRSCYDVAKEAGFLGCVEGGPDDLSVSAMHREGFGRD